MMNEWMNEWMNDWLIEKIHIYLYISFSDGTNNILLQIWLCSISMNGWMNELYLIIYQTHIKHISMRYINSVNEWMNEWMYEHILNTY